MDNTILIAILGSGVLSAIISGSISLIGKKIDRKYKKEDDASEKLDKIASIEKKLIHNERDSVRMQMLLMMSDYPNEIQEIMRLAEHYFDELKGNWYMTTMFNKWLESNEIAKPNWFKEE